jgi:hypothetical protein
MDVLIAFDYALSLRTRFSRESHTIQFELKPKNGATHS